ncbi:MAG TPA: hypothetical protein VHY35_05260 [Stellaceae bacterium]|nr:hypothetical protein [Stellaceae bacterium]
MTGPDIIDFISDPDALGPSYAGPSWDRWRACLRAAYALPMSDVDLALFSEVAGGRAPPLWPVSEFVALVGRGGGKDAVAAAIAAHIASTSDFRRLRPGERGSVLLIAVDREQAGIAFGYIRALFEQVPMLAALVEKIVDDTVLLTNGAAIIVATNSYRSVRGKTIICTIFDEVCFWRSADSASPDIEVDAAVSPGLARWPGAMKILISSVYRRAGLAHQRFKDCFGQDDPETLVVLGGTRQFNPNFDAKVIDRALARDYARASAEYLSIWRDDLSSFVDPEAVAACVAKGCRQRAYNTRIGYRAFCDPSGGRGDSMTLGIAHRDKDGKAILDHLEEARPPFDPKVVVASFASILKVYKIRTVIGDNYSGNWCVSEFREHGVVYEPSERNRSQIYFDLLPLINSGQVELLDNDRLISQLCALERRTTKGGRDSIGHPETGSGAHHDDCANAAAGALVNVEQQPARMMITKEMLTAAGIPRYGRYQNGFRRVSDGEMRAMLTPRFGQ